MKEFETVWTYLQGHLKAGISIPNWTAFRGYFGDDIMIDKVQDQSILVYAPSAKTLQRVPKSDFESVWRDWPGYKSRKVKRYELRDVNWHTRYVINILQWYEEEVSNG